MNGGSKRRLFFEIGAGYGSTAHHISNILHNNTYIIVDLPETLMFSATYLSLLNANKKIYLYDAQSVDNVLQSDRIVDYDFVLVPDYQLDKLRDLDFDVVINVASLQEMRVDQVERYLAFIQRTCRGIFYCYNQDAQPKNEELDNLTERLRRRFEIEDIPQPSSHQSFEQKMLGWLRSALRGGAAMVGLASRGETNLLNAVPYRPYICKPLPCSDE